MDVGRLLRDRIRNENLHMMVELGGLGTYIADRSMQ